MEFQEKQRPSHIASSSATTVDDKAAGSAERRAGCGHTRNSGLDPAERQISIPIQSDVQAEGSNLGAETKFTRPRLSFERANAPFLAQPVAPFAKSERKRAMLAAIYYSECFLNGITPIEADTAALSAQSHYDKWWINENNEEKGHERRKREKSNHKKLDQRGGYQSCFADPSFSGTYKKRKVADPESPTEEKKGSQKSIYSEGVRNNHFPSDNWTEKQSKFSSLDKCKETQTEPSSSPEDSGVYEADTAQSVGSSSFCDNHAAREDQSIHYKNSVESCQMRVVAGRLEPFVSTTLAATRILPKDEIDTVKCAMIRYLESSGGDTMSSRFLSYLDFMHYYYSSRKIDARWGVPEVCPASFSHRKGSPCNHGALNNRNWFDGTWFALSTPTYKGCLGINKNNEMLYSLGQLSFDMFCPCDLVCSVQSVCNSIGLTNLNSTNNKRARSFRFRFAEEQQHRSHCGGGQTTLSEFPATQNYDIIVAFSVEPNQTRRGIFVTDANESSQGKDGSLEADTNSCVGNPEPGSGEYVVRKPIRGLLTNYGQCIPDPSVPNRLSLCFSGGLLEVQDKEKDLDDWKELLDEKEVNRRDAKKFTRALATRLLLDANLPEGMDHDGSMRYTLKRPIGGHGSVFYDVLYADESLCIARDHENSIIVLTRR